MPNQNNILYSVLVAEKDSKFRSMLLATLQKEAERLSRINIIITTVGNPSSLKSYKKSETDLAFINLNFMEGNFTTFKNLKGFSPDTIFVLLISDEGGKHIKKAIATFKSQDHYFFDEHILTDNYSANILFLFCRELLRKMIGKKNK